MPTLDTTIAALTAKFISDVLTAMRAATIADLHSVQRGTSLRTRRLAIASKRRAPASKLALAAADAEKKQVRMALDRSRGNRSRAAQLLGVSRPTLYRKLVEFGIE